MSFQIGNAQLGVNFVGDTSVLQRALNQAGDSVDNFGARSVNAMRAAQTMGDDVARGFSRSAVSAAQMQNAMRGVPAQFTDIFVSLQAGQNPMTVFLQQGGQLKDMFGGVGPAARAMGGYITGLVNPFTLGAAAVGAIALAAYKGASEIQTLNRSLILSGGTAGVTAGQLMDMAASIDVVNSSITQGRAAEALDAMMQAGVRGEAQLKRYAQAAAEFEAAGGGAAAEVAKNFEALGRDPVAASAKLTQSMGYLTAATYEQIRSLEEQGRTLDAAKLAQDAYASALESRTPALLQNLGAIERGWQGVKNIAKEAWDAMLNVGRPASLSDQINAVEQRLAAARGHKTLGAGNGFDVPDPRTAADKALLDSLREQQRLAGRSADMAAERAQREQAGVVWLQQGDRLMTSQAKLAADIAKARQQGLAAGKSEVEIEQRVQAIRAAADKGGRASLKRDEFAAVFGRLTAKDAGLDPSFYKDLNILYEGYQRGRVGVDDYREAVETLISTQRYAKDIESERLQAIKDEDTANKASAKSLEDRVSAAEKAARTARDNAQAMEREVELIGMSEGQLHDLEQARLADAAASLRRRAAIMADIDLSGRAAEALRAEADELDALAAAKGRGYLRRAEVAGEEAVAQSRAAFMEETRRRSETLADSITDGIMEGARNGASIMEIFRNELRAQFARTILRPVIQPVADGLSSVIEAGLSSLTNLFSPSMGPSMVDPSASFASDFSQYLVPNANGGVYSGPGISAYSSQVVDRPTLFAFAKGAGLMGEAGEEGILPLRRDSSGRLGVTAAGVGGGNVTINFINQSGQQLTASQRTSKAGDGSMVVDLVVQMAEARIADGVANRSGPVSRALEGGWGLRPAMS